ncbi:MAG: cell division protein FtsK, partial [Gordonia amarae]
HWRKHKLILAGVDPDAVDAPEAVLAQLPSEQAHDPLIARLLEVAQSRFPGKLSLDPSTIEFDNEKGKSKLVSWGFTCVEPGFLTDVSVQSRLQSTFMRALGGVWKFEFEVTADRFGGSRRTGLPKLVFPPLWPVVGSVEEAKSSYPGWELKVGVTADGELGFRMDKMPHLKVIGETGSGKSVAVRSWLEQYRAMGWQLILADGKGADYVGYITPNEDDNGLPVPGTVAVGLGATPKGMSYVGAIVIAYLIMQDRQSGSAEAKIADPDGWSNFAPVLLVMDEIKGMREKWRGALPKADQKAIESMVTEITSLGRELRVHALLVSQDARDVSIPGVWSSNLPLSISLGKPKPITVNKAFDDSVRPKVQMLQSSMDPNQKGRCLIAAVDKETGAADVLEYQGFIGYAPGESWNNDNVPKLAAEPQNWPLFKDRVSDRVPRLYTRQWFKLDEPSAAQLEKEEADEWPMGYIDFDMFTVEELKDLELVALDYRDSKGVIRPNPDMARYDPSSPTYVCRAPVRRRQVATSEL